MGTLSSGPPTPHLGCQNLGLANLTIGLDILPVCSCVHVGIPAHAVPATFQYACWWELSLHTGHLYFWRVCWGRRMWHMKARVCPAIAYCMPVCMYDQVT